MHKNGALKPLLSNHHHVLSSFFSTIVTFFPFFFSIFTLVRKPFSKNRIFFHNSAEFCKQFIPIGHRNGYFESCLSRTESKRSIRFLDLDGFNQESRASSLFVDLIGNAQTNMKRNREHCNRNSGLPSK